MSNTPVLSSDSHVFEPPDLWTSRIDKKYKERAPHMQRIDGADQLVVEGDQAIAGIGLISNAGARFEAPETIRDHAVFEDVHKGGFDPDQHLSDMRLDGVSGEVLYPSQGLFYFKIRDSDLFSAVCRAYNDWLEEFCSTDRDRLKAIAMINVDDVSDAVGELTRCAKMGFSGGMITEYPAEERRYDHPDYEALWAASAELNMPLSLHTATRRQGTNAGSAERTIRDASRRATKAFLPAISVCDMMYSGVFDRHPDFKLAIVEFELAWVPYLLSNMDYTYRERHDEATYRFKDDKMPSDLFAHNVFLSFQEDDIGIRLRDVIGVDRMMWGSDYPHSESTFPHSQQILDRILKDVSEKDRQSILFDTTADLYGFDRAKVGMTAD